MNGFHDYVLQNMNGVHDHSYILSGYTTFLMSKSETRNQIFDARKSWFVNNYTNYENNRNKQELYDYYNNNITDTYSYKYDPPPCIFNEIDRQKQKEVDENNERYNDDIEVHYRDISNRHLTYKVKNEEPTIENECSDFEDNTETFSTEDENNEMYDDYYNDNYDNYDNCEDYEETDDYPSDYDDY